MSSTPPKIPFFRLYLDIMRQSSHHSPAEINIGLCSICGDRADGYHYGVLSCRGCNAFFRRAVAFNLQFHCRRERRCEINKNARCACRACRLQKCREMGMDPSAVQVRREVKDVLGLNNHHHTNSNTRNSDFLSFAGPSGSIIDHPSSKVSISSAISASVFGSAKMLDSPNLKSRLLGSMTSFVAHSPRVVHPLDRLVEWYFCQRYRRSSMLCQTVEQILSSMDSGSQHFAYDIDSGDGSQATPEGWSQVNKVQMVLMFEWAEQLEEFGEQHMEDPMDKTRLLRTFGPRYFLLDAVIYSLEQGCSDRLVLPNGTSISREDEYKFHRISPPTFGSSQDEVGRLRAMKMMNSEGLLSAIEELVQPLADMEITFGEFMALRLLLFWDPELGGNSPAQSRIVQNAFERALTDLQSWYELHSMGTNGSQRLESLLVLLPIIKKFADYLCKIIVLIPGFNKMPEWQFIADLVLGPKFE